MNTLERFIPLMRNEWYVQGCNAVPSFLSVSAYSGMTMEKELGFGYSMFMFPYRNGYGEMWYLQNDLTRVWNHVKREILRDPNFLQTTKVRYETIFTSHAETLRICTEDLRSLDDAGIVSLIKECSETQTDAVGIAHILDALGIELEREFKERLFEAVPDRKRFNDYYPALSATEKLSFIAREENDLRRIAMLPKGVRQNAALQIHHSRYAWIQNNYSGPKDIGMESYERRLKEKQIHTTALSNIREDKERIIAELGLDEQTVSMINMIEFATIWQDERKENVLRSIGIFGAVLDEASRRLSIPKPVLYYLTVPEISGLVSLEDLQSLKALLEERMSGSFYLMTQDGVDVATGEAYGTLHRERERTFDEEALAGKTEIQGSIANKGTAIGKVRVCLDLESIGLVEEGDILVTSMTRPEYMPALKKAAAIVTDEGGITSHAAIIARELDIPAVIGTKTATRLLKDGMLVEVRANHGAVRIL